MEAERKYYLGRLKDSDKVPGSDVTIEDARKAYREGVRIEEARMAKRQREYLEEREKVTGANVITTAVTHGVTREITIPAVSEPVLGSPEAVADAIHNPYTEESLKGKTKAELVSIAEELDIHVVPDNMTNAKIVEAILGQGKA